MPSPICFLHVPKSAGTSVHAALEAELPDGALAPRRSDTSIFCDFSDFQGLDEDARALVAVGDSEVAELARYRAVSGHFSLPTLLRLAPAANVATVLREPRARLLSVYMFLRLSPMIDFWGPYGAEVLAAPARSLEACLSDPRIAGSTDNQVCRMILHGDPRIRDGEFVDPADAEGLAADALEQLDRLAFVGVLELGDVWQGMSRLFGVSLEPIRTNVSGADVIPDGGLPIPAFDMRRVLHLVEQRSVADRLVYDALVTQRCGSRAEARSIADAAFAEALVRFGDMAGASATKLSGWVEAGR